VDCQWANPEELMYELTYEVLDALPKQAPKYMMGVGDPVQIVELASMGIDMFDCVQPTRHARHGLGLLLARWTSGHCSRKIQV